MATTTSHKTSRSTVDQTINVAILGSGNGSNAENIVKHFVSNKKIKIRLIISNKADAGILERAERLNVPSVVIPAADWKDKRKVNPRLRKHKIDFIVLAGFLLKVPDYLTEKYRGKMINIHPALLPAYGGRGMYGMHVHNAVKKSGDSKSGITIHYVNENYDEGAIIFQKEIGLDKDESAETIAAKVHELEYEWYPKVVEMVAGN